MKALGAIQIADRYKRISMDFIESYPLTQFMTDRELDCAHAAIRPEIQLNVLMVGFGGLNETLFAACISTEQYLSYQDGKLLPKQVNYHLYDRDLPLGEDAEKKGPSDGFFRYEAFLKAAEREREDYLEFAPPPAIAFKHALAIGSSDFFRSVQEVLSDAHSYTYIILSFGSDAQNIHLAETLLQKLKEWEISAPVKLFVQVEKLPSANSFAEDSPLIFFGADRGCVCNTKSVLGRMERMAELRHAIYSAEYEIKEDGADPKTAFMQEKHRRPYDANARDANLAACLGLRMKLHLLGYDFSLCGKDCAKHFLEFYETGDARVPLLESKYKTIWKYSNGEQFRPSRRFALAVQEHRRWCANKIMCGFLPCKKEDLTDREKLRDNRLHGNLTTMEGLAEFRKIMAEKRGLTEEQTDVIRYDYQIMDDAVWLLESCGYTLVRRETSQKA